MRSILLLFCTVALAALVAQATNIASLGYTESGSTIDDGIDDSCDSVTLFVNHDGSFENGYAWQYGGTVAPYYGAFGEGYDLGYGDACCGAFWVSTLPGYFFGQSADLYVWEGGVGGAPGAVLDLVPGVVFTNVPNWPTCGQNDVMLINSPEPNGPFTVGYWGNWPGALCGYFCGADLNGFGGNPWTNIAPGIGYPTGWQDPSIVWGPTQSMGIGVYFGGCVIHSPVESETWGAIKTLFR